MLKSIWVWISASAVLFLSIFKSVFARRVRLGKSQAHSLWEQLNKRGRTFVLEGEEVKNKFPVQHRSLAILDKVWMYTSVEERFLRAGREGTDSVANITVFRWQYKKLMSLITRGETSTKDSVPIYIMRMWDALKIGKLTGSWEQYTPYTAESVYRTIEWSVEQVIGSGEKTKTGVLLHGPPGNGKSYFVRYLAVKYRLPVYVFLLEQSMSNLDVVTAFSHVQGPCIVLFEDFDSYFDSKKPRIERALYTLDGILNVLDGMFYTPEGVVFAMTVNDIDKVDDALKSRPSRFEYVTLFGNPDSDTRRRVFDGCRQLEKLVTETAGMSLDQVLSRRGEIERDGRVKLKAV